MTTRVIRKDGPLYRLAYAGREEKDKPKTVNLCNLVWRAAWSIVTAVVTLIIACGVLLVLLACLVGFAVMLWGAGTAIVAWLISPHLPALSESDGITLIFASVAIGIALTVIALYAGFVRAKKSETGRLLAAYVRAKKQKICPIYKVV
jgi:uncharacterized membrane protein